MSVEVSRPPLTDARGLTEPIGFDRKRSPSAAGSKAGVAATSRSLDAAWTGPAEPAVDPRDRMIAIFGHDLRGLLNAFTVNSEVFLRRQGDDAADSARTVRLTVARMDKLISSLLDFARLRTEKLEIHCRPLDARVLLQEVVEIFRPLAGSKSVALTLAVPDEPLAVEADPERMFQVLSNLLSNAIDFSSARGRISVEGAISGADVELSVVDDGPGIPVEDLDRVFESFYQLDTGRSHGLGLGLYIARSIVDAHGGRLWVASQLGVGSTFHVRLPGERAVRHAGGG
jgi:signal transduction histidine kinase